MVPHGDQDDRDLDYERVYRTHEIARLNAGQSFGELALIYDSPRTATV